MTMTSSNKNIPKGFGFYLRRISKPSSDLKEPKALLERCKASKASWVSFMVESENGLINRLEYLKAYRDVLVAGGVDIWVWTFPGILRTYDASNSRDAASLAIHYCKELNAKGIMLDIERAYKGKRLALNALVDTTVANTKETDLSVGFVSYPIPSFHKDIDWTCLAKCDWGSPMLYDSSKDKKLIDMSYTQYTNKCEIWIPSLATYDTEASDTEEVQLKGDLDRVFEGNGNKHINAAIFWSESTTSDKERKVLADYSDLLFI